MVSHKPDVMDFSPKDMDWQGVTLSRSAAKRITQLSTNGQSILLTVKSSGCTGYAYVLEQIDEPDKDVLKFESNGSAIFVSLSAMPFVDGTEVDYVREGLNQNFVYRNPNVKSECGCGESFGV